MSKKVFEKKLREEEEATAYVFQEFIKEFQNSTGPPGKTFVRSSILNANTEQQLDSQRATVYNPRPFARQQTDQTIKNAIECARLIKENRIERTKGQSKPKTNLELLKEELKIRHMERDEKNKHKEETAFPGIEACDGNDCTTTNLFLSNLNPKFTEKDLIQLFGTYGPLASVKIMWPRGEEKYRNSNCGFVAFMSRKDAERALQQLKDRDDMRVGWGKPVDLPPNPIYIPPELLKFFYPPPFSGLPFNAQPLKNPYKMPTTEEEMDDLLRESVVKVTIPLDKKVLSLVHRMVEFVVREGPFFEAIIMNKEINNPAFQFLFDNKSSVHLYYRWKLYSVLHGESLRNWSKKEFRMYEGGPIWIPPVTPDYTQGMPESLLATDSKNDKKQLSDAQASRFVQLVQNLDLTKAKIGEAMVFCINHNDAARDIKDILIDSLKNTNSKATKKIARLYLLSDVMCNSVIKKHSNIYLTEVENELVEVFENLRLTFSGISNAVDKDAFRTRVIKVLRAWTLFKIYSNDFLSHLEHTFLGTFNENKVEEESDENDEPLDGANLIKRSMKNNPEYLLEMKKADIGENEKEHRTEDTTSKYMPGFIPSKWETVDPEQVEAQAMSTEKYYYMEIERKLTDAAKKPTKKERELLRKIEVKVVQYQDEVESGRRKLKSGGSLEDELKKLRQKLFREYKKNGSSKSKRRSSSSSSSEEEEASKVAPKKIKKKEFGHREKDRDRHRKRSHK